MTFFSFFCTLSEMPLKNSNNKNKIIIGKQLLLFAFDCYKNLT